MQQKIVFFGSGDFTIPVVQKLLPHGLDLVVTNDKNPNSLLSKFCAENHIEVLICSTSSELINHQPLIINHSLAILASYGAFIPKSIIDCFDNGIINIHPSLLPKYKGPSPVQYALLNGETITGVTLIKLDSEIDHGPILSQKPYNLMGNETSEDLLSILFEIGADMVEEIVIKLENGKTITQTSQDHQAETWSYKLEKKNGFIDISSPQFKISNLKFKIDNMVRAFYPWPGVWFRYEIAASTSSPHNDEERHNVFASGAKQSSLENKIIKLLPEGRIQVEGKNPMNYKDFINGFGVDGKELLENLHLI